MAGAYRTYLKQRGQLPDKPADALTLYYGALGALDKEDSFLFIPITRLAAMTSFSDMEAIARELTDAGVSDLAIRYFGLGQRRAVLFGDEQGQAGRLSRGLSGA